MNEYRDGGQMRQPLRGRKQKIFLLMVRSCRWPAGVDKAGFSPAPACLGGEKREMEAT